MGKRIISMNIEAKSSSEVHITILGNTWPYRERLNEFGIGGGWMETNNDSNPRVYCRAKENIDLTAADKQLIPDLITSVFKNAAIRVRLDGTTQEDTPVADLITTLKNMPAVFIVKNTI